jgi:hypothetical protein
MLFSWSIAFSTCNNVDEMLSVFYSVIFQFIDQFVPWKNRKNSKFPHFYSKASINLFNLKKKKHKKDIKSYEFLRAAFKDSVKKDHSSYINQLENHLRENNVQPFWSHIRQSKNNRSFFPKEMSFKNNKSSNDQTSADFFADYFESVFERYDDEFSDNFADSDLNNIHFSQETIAKLLRKLDTKKSCGPNGILNIFLKKTANVVAYPLYLIFTKCLDEGVFPKEWKFSLITPIHKKGPKDNVANYRPIAKLSCIGKIFEKLLTDSIFITISNKIMLQQYGFFKNRST